MSEFFQSSAVWGVALTMGAFGLGTVIHRKTGAAWCNPLLLGSVFVIVFLSILDIPYADYKSSASPISYLLLPATVSLAIPLYEQWQLLKDNALAIIIGIASGVVTSLLSILIVAWLLGLDYQLTVTLLPKSVTTAIGMDVSAELGGVASLTSGVIVLTGIFGNMIAAAVCRVFHITHPIAKGVGIGTAAHAIGTSRALQMGPVEGAMSSLSIAVAGVLTAILCPIVANFL